MVVAGPKFAEAAAVEASAGLVVFEQVDVASILDCLQARTRPGDLVLIKGSRSAGLERVVEAMAAGWTAEVSNGEPNS